MSKMYQQMTETLIKLTDVCFKTAFQWDFCQFSKVME